jgi:hypothetical protein
MITAEDILNDPKYREMDCDTLDNEVCEIPQEEFRKLTNLRDYDGRRFSVAAWLVDHYYPNNPPRPLVEQVSDMKFWAEHELEAIDECEMRQLGKPPVKSLIVGKRYQVLNVRCDDNGKTIVEINSEFQPSHLFAALQLAFYFKVVKKQKAEPATIAQTIKPRLSEEEMNRLISNPLDESPVRFATQKELEEYFKKKVGDTGFKGFVIKVYDSEFKSTELTSADRLKQINRAMAIGEQFSFESTKGMVTIGADAMKNAVLIY